MVGKPPERTETISQYELSLIDLFRFITLNNAETIFERLRNDLKVSEIDKVYDYYIPEWNITWGQLIEVIQRLRPKRRPKMDEEETSAFQKLVTFEGFEVCMGWFINSFSAQDIFFVNGGDITLAIRLLRKYIEINTLKLQDGVSA